MFDDLNVFLNSNENCIKEYIISCVEDLSNEKKINFTITFENEFNFIQ